MPKKKLKRPRLVDIIRLGSVLAEVVRAILDADRGDVLRLSLDLKRVGEKPWQLKPTGDAKVEVVEPKAVAETDQPKLAPGAGES